MKHLTLSLIKESNPYGGEYLVYNLYLRGFDTHNPAVDSYCPIDMVDGVPKNIKPDIENLSYANFSIRIQADKRNREFYGYEYCFKNYTLKPYRVIELAKTCKKLNSKLDKLNNDLGYSPDAYQYIRRVALALKIKYFNIDGKIKGIDSLIWELKDNLKSEWKEESIQLEA